MKTNLIMFVYKNDNSIELENQLIEYYNPPLNLSKNHSETNKEFRKALSKLRSNKKTKVG